MLLRGRRLLLITASLVLGLGGTAARAVAQTDAPTQYDPSVLAVLDAKKGTFDSASGKVTLRGVAPRAVWFTDRPRRDTGAYTVPQLLSTFFDGQPPPNAALEFVGAAEGSDVAVIEMSNPKFDATRNQLTFIATPIGDPTKDLRTDTALVDFVRRHDGKIAKAFGATHIFVDSASPDGVGGSPSDLTAAACTASAGDNADTTKVNCKGTVNENSSESFEVDCTNYPGVRYVDREGDAETVFDFPHIDARGALVTYGYTDEVSEPYKFLSRVVTKIRVTLTNDKNIGPGNYDVDVYCTADRGHGWLVVG